MKLMLKTITGREAFELADRCLVPATETDAEIFEKFRGNTWYKSDCRKARNPEFHNKGMALARMIFDNQELYANFEDLLVELKLKAGWYTEHIRSAPASSLLRSMHAFANQCPGRIREKMIGFIQALRKQESIVYLPKSISFAEMDALEFQEFYNRVFEIARDDYKLEEALDFIGARRIEVADEPAQK